MIVWWVPCKDTGGCAVPAELHVEGADEVLRHPLQPGQAGFGAGRITCPDCAMASSNPNDRAHGYCANCHWPTSELEMWQARRAELAERRDLARRYFRERIAPGLAADGTPADGIDHRRRRYVRDAMGNTAAMRLLAEWAALGHPGG